MRFVSGVDFNTPCTGCLDASCGLLFFFFNVVVYSKNSETLTKPIVILVTHSHYKIKQIPCSMFLANWI